ncbi:hypothetical protein ESCO_002607 [Escovopsis weberi]|uniref:Uncharacterized protein n=1 Tax=Escovopsis weberi TaxID=150374 RepID=A0A0M8N1U0_ESCWE|nr:hypothetical protein ESCO_002607 [Escovopsis weberi]
MNLNLQSDSEFDPFSDSQETAAMEDGHLDAPFMEESSDIASAMPTHSPPAPPSPPSPPSAPFPTPSPAPPTALVASLQRLRSQSVGVHRHQFKVLSRIQEPESSDEKDNKFHSDPFDLEFRSRLQSTSGLAAFSQKHGLTPSSSRYTFGPNPELPHIDSFASRPMSGLGYHEWADFGHEIRIAMMGGDDTSTLRSNDSCYSGERTMVEGHHDP